MTSITSWRTDHEAQRLDSQNIIHWSPVKWLVPSAREQLQFVVEVNDSTMDVCNFHEFSACAIVWQPFQIHTKHQSHILGVYPLHRLYIDLKYTVGTSNLGSWHGHLGVADEITGLFFFVRKLNQTHWTPGIMRYTSAISWWLFYVRNIHILSNCMFSTLI